MREDGGYEIIKKAIEKLGLRHKEHIAAYGEGNERRLTGKHETADINTFTWVSYLNTIMYYVFQNLTLD
jgi:glutamine synthetase